MSEQKELKKRLKVLMLRPENQVCSDCTERQPRWASLIVPPPGAPEGSLPIGAFCCLECSGSHRRLGVHISFVRSINLDSWKEREVQAMENGGNAKVNAIFEANLNREKPTNHADLQTRERYIRDKYERRKFYNPSAFGTFRAPAAPPAPARAPAKQQPKEIALPALASSAVGPPSDVAQRRIQERRRRSMANGKEPERSLRRIGSSEEGGKKKKSTSRKVKSQGSNVSTASTSSVDLLDFGAGPPAPAPASNPATDLFGFVAESAAATSSSPSETFGNSFTGGSGKGNAAADIMALYGSGGGNAPTQQVQQHGYGNSARPNGMNTSGMNVMTNQMGQMNLGGGNNMWTPQQQQQMMMMQQQQMMMMMQQQQQQGKFNQQMMNGSNFNPQMMNGTMMGQQQNNGFGGQMANMGGKPRQAPPQKEDPFASLGGRNTFR